MKKVISLLLVVILAFSLSVTAMAVSYTGTGSQDVDAEYVAGTVTTTGTIYSVHLDWTSFEDLTYTQGNTTYRWDAAAQKYVVDSSTESKWSGGNFSVAVTNRSNAAITATAAYVDTADDGLTTEMNWTTKTGTCESAAKNIAADYSGTGTPTSVTLSGTVKVTAGTINADTTGVGTISITID